MADGTFPGLVSKNRDVNAVDNAIFVQLSDGSTALGVTGDALNVSISNTSIVVTATDLDIRDLAHTQDSVAIGDGTDLLDVNADGSINITDNGGSITVDGAVEISTASGTTITVDGTVDIGSVAGTVTVTATDLDIRDLSASQDNVAISDGTDTLEVNTDGSINVNVVQAALSDEFHDFDQASAVAGSGTSNHDYTVANTTALITGVYIGASGDAKFEIQVDNGGGFNTVAVGFTTGKQGDSKLVAFPTPLEATTTVRVIRTNRENQAQDLYSTIMGRDVA